MLTVADAAASEAGSVLQDDPVEVLRRAAAGARAAWLRTPRMLPVLRRAGVVDAGAAGVVALLEAMAGAAAGTPPPSLAPPAPVAPPLAVVSDSSPRYCTEVLIRVRDVSAGQVRRALRRLGDAVVVAERDGRLRIHLHTHAPHRVLARALRWGEVEQVRAVRLPPEPQEGCAGPED